MSINIESESLWLNIPKQEVQNKLDGLFLALDIKFTLEAQYTIHESSANEYRFHFAFVCLVLRVLIIMFYKKAFTSYKNSFHSRTSTL